MIEVMSSLLIYSAGAVTLFATGWAFNRYRTRQLVEVKNAEIRRLQLELSENVDTTVFRHWDSEVRQIRRRLP